MAKLIKKLLLVLLPVAVYFAMFIYFEPYNYFGLKSGGTEDSAIVRVRNYTQNPSDVIIVGDSRMAHFEMDKVNELVGENVGQLSFGGASFNESMDLIEYALEVNPDIHTVYVGVSFYTLNESYYKDRMSSIKTIATNPFAYMLNFNYNIEMLNEIKYALTSSPDADTEEIGHWTDADYKYEDGTPRKYRKNLEEYAGTIYSVCENYKMDDADIDRYVALCNDLSEKGITVYTVLPPMDETIRDLVVDKIGIGDDLQKFIDRAEKCSTVLNYEYVDESPFTEYNYYDGFHLDLVTGLPLFTEMLFGR